jgi:hypothetical protein
VQGFTEKREAKKYASQMLKTGFIKHTVNKVFGPCDSLYSYLYSHYHHSPGYTLVAIVDYAPLLVHLSKGKHRLLDVASLHLTYSLIRLRVTSAQECC